VIDVRAVFQQTHHELTIEAMPALLVPQKGRYGLRDYEKIFCADIKSGNDVFAMRGIPVSHKIEVGDVASLAQSISAYSKARGRNVPGHE
jgi:hypothetical protein